MKKHILLAALALAAATAPAFAHTGIGAHASLFAGVVHPFSGLDHILAMVAVGLWASQQGGRAMWVLPGAFVGTMLAGGVVGMSGFALPLVEPMILASIVVLGLMVALAVQLPLAAGAALVSVFALMHGFAHGSELAGGHALPYIAGFAFATASLHAAGLAGGILGKRAFAPAIVRFAGLATLALGGALAMAG